MPEIIINEISNVKQASDIIRDLSEAGFTVVANSSDGHWSISARSIKPGPLSAIQQLIHEHLKPVEEPQHA